MQTTSIADLKRNLNHYDAKVSDLRAKRAETLARHQAVRNAQADELAEIDKAMHEIEAGRSKASGALIDAMIEARTSGAAG